MQTGQKELDGIVQSFVGSVRALGPAVTTPPGLVTVVNSAIDHFGQALGVVGRVRTELDTHTASMSELTPRAVDPVGGRYAGGPAAAAAPLLSTGAQQASSLMSGLMSSGGSMMSSMTSPAGMATSSKSHAGAAGRPAPGGNQPAADKPGKHGGVMITLPDGSQVEAPNEKAATAVKSADQRRAARPTSGVATPRAPDSTAAA